MKAFLDTSVLIATFYAHHQFHQPSIDLFLRFKKNEECCGAHSLAEIYCSLTGRTRREPSVVTKRCYSSVMCGSS